MCAPSCATAYRVSGTSITGVSLARIPTGVLGNVRLALRATWTTILNCLMQGARPGPPAQSFRPGTDRDHAKAALWAGGPAGWERKIRHVQDGRRSDLTTHRRHSSGTPFSACIP